MTRPKIPVTASVHVLQPFNRREAMTIATAAKLIGQSPANVRRLVGRYCLGRRIAGGPWYVSRVAFQLFANGDDEGLRAYHEDDRQHPRVRALFSAIGMG